MSDGKPFFLANQVSCSHFHQCFKLQTMVALSGVFCFDLIFLSSGHNILNYMNMKLNVHSDLEGSAICTPLSCEVRAARNTWDDRQQ